MVEGYAAATARIQAAVVADVPRHLAEAQAQLEEARREHDALQQAVEGKVGGWGWVGAPGRLAKGTPQAPRRWWRQCKDCDAHAWYVGIPLRHWSAPPVHFSFATADPLHRHLQRALCSAAGRDR